MRYRLGFLILAIALAGPMIDPPGAAASDQPVMAWKPPSRSNLKPYAQDVPSGGQITPVAAPHSVIYPFVPDLPNASEWQAGQAATTAVSPDGKTLLVLTTGYNIAPAPAPSDEYIFVYDISQPKPVKKQVLGVPNTYLGMTWNPNGKEFYVSGGVNDNLHIFADQGGGSFAEVTPPIALNNGEAPGLFAPQFGFPGLPVAAGVAVNPAGNKLLIANIYNDSVSLIDLATKSVVAVQDLRPGKINPAQEGVPGGEYPLWPVFVGESKAYVSSQRDREIVVLGIAGNSLSVTDRIKLKGMPNKMLLSPDGKYLYVAVDNSDTVAVIETDEDEVEEEIVTTAPEEVYGNDEMLRGSNPNSLALSPDGSTLFVTNGGTNSVAIIELGHVEVAKPAKEEEEEEAGERRSRVIGLIPTAWYPNSVSLSADGQTLYIVNGKTVAGPNPNGPRSPLGATGQEYVFALLKAGLAVVPLPSKRDLAGLTWQVAANNNFPSVAGHDANAALMKQLRKKIDHVIYIIKENRTYDQVLGDLPYGNGDPQLALFPQPISPNHHKLATQFVTFDNLYVSGGVSGDGWSWSVAGRTNDFTEKSIHPNYAGRGFAYEYEGPNRNLNMGLATSAERHALNPESPTDPDILPGFANITENDGPNGEAGQGYIWNAAIREGLTARNYGCFIDLWHYDYPPLIPLYREPDLTNNPVAFGSNETLAKITNVYYRGYDMAMADYWKVKVWEREYDTFVKNGKMPNLMIMALPHDHFGRFGSALDGVNTPDKQMADNDYALGLIVQKVAKGPYGKRTLIFVIEDDAQNGADHVDAQRSLGYIVGPYVKSRALVSTRYNTVNMVRTIEDVLGLEPLGLQDGLAEPMADAFDLKQTAFSYNPEVPEILYTTDLPLPPKPVMPSRSGFQKAFSQPTRDAAYWEQAFAGQNFAKLDSLDPVAFNLALWKGLKGDDVPYPDVRHGRDLRENREPLIAAYHASFETRGAENGAVQLTGN